MTDAKIELRARWLDAIPSVPERMVAMGWPVVPFDLAVCFATDRSDVIMWNTHGVWPFMKRANYIRIHGAAALCNMRHVRLDYPLLPSTDGVHVKQIGEDRLVLSSRALLILGVAHAVATPAHTFVPKRDLQHYFMENSPAWKMARDFWCISAHEISAFHCATMADNR